MKNDLAPLGCSLVGANTRKPKPLMLSACPVSQSSTDRVAGASVSLIRSASIFGMRLLHRHRPAAGGPLAFESVFRQRHVMSRRRYTLPQAAAGRQVCPSTDCGFL